MVALDAVKASNATVAKQLPPGLVAVFVGGTSGIGEFSLKALAKHTVKPTIYIVGRNAEAAARIIAECRALNPDGEYFFIQKSLGLLREAEELCGELKTKLKYINILCLSIGEADLRLEGTSEGIRPLFSVAVFGRLLIAKRLLPLIQAAPHLRRIIDVAGGAHEGELDMNDLGAMTFNSRNKLRGHLSTVKTLSWRRFAHSAPDVSVVTEFPGLVITNLFNRIEGWLGVFARTLVFLFGWMLAVSHDECGERHVFMATSAAFPPAKGEAVGVPLVGGVEVHGAAYGQAETGLYSVDWDCEGPGEKITALLNRYEEDGTADKVWAWMQREYARVLGAEL